jgi:hypothetical protein
MIRSPRCAWPIGNRGRRPSAKRIWCLTIIIFHTPNIGHANTPDAECVGA